jgi:hypothetical protein
MKRTQTFLAALTAVAVLTGGSAFAGAKPAAKTAKHKMPAKSAKAPKFKAETFMCQHGCKKMITVKAAADMKKKCPVCMCKQMTSVCKPAKKA